jgi:hypothetical protein
VGPPIDEFRLEGPGNLDLARQSAQERSDALGIEVRIVDERGTVVDTVEPRKPASKLRRNT